jgi:hypothetical protein
VKARTLTAAAFVAAALVTSVGSGQSKGIRPLTLRPASLANPLLGFSVGRLDTSLVRLDSRTLLPRGRGVSLERFTAAWSFSPDRRQLVFASAYSPYSESPAAVRFIDVSTLRRLRDLELGPAAEVQAVDWAAPERLLAVVRSCCPAVSSVSLIDTASGTVLARHVFEGELVGAGRAHGALVLLLEPASFGPVWLAVAGADGSFRTVVLDRVLGGVSTSPPPNSYLVDDRAGLAVDPSGGRAYAVAANGPIAEVDLERLGVTYHTLAKPASLFGRLHDWLEPKAEAKTAAERSARFALWLGDGRLAVFGRNGSARWKDGRLAVRTWPSVLMVVDTSTWTSQVIDSRSNSAVVARDMLLSSGWSWDSETQRTIGNGIRVYGADGRQRFQLLKNRVVVQPEVFGSHAFVQKPGQDLGYWVVSLASGQVLRSVRNRPMPFLLRGAGST